MSESPCAGCQTPCCAAHRVQADGFDLPRLVRGLQVPWDAVAEVAAFPQVVEGAFRLDGGEGSLMFYLLRQPGSGACQFLLHLPYGHRRCGVYGVRPAACRIYPLIPSDLEEHGAWVWGMARCPEPARAQFTASLPLLRPQIQADNAQRVLHGLLVEKWNGFAVTHAAGILLVGDLISWLLRIYDALGSAAQVDRALLARAATVMAAVPCGPQRPKDP